MTSQTIFTCALRNESSKRKNNKKRAREHPSVYPSQFAESPRLERCTENPKPTPRLRTNIVKRRNRGIQRWRPSIQSAISHVTAVTSNPPGKKKVPPFTEENLLSQRSGGVTSRWLSFWGNFKGECAEELPRDSRTNRSSPVTSHGAQQKHSGPCRRQDG